MAFGFTSIGAAIAFDENLPTLNEEFDFINTPEQLIPGCLVTDLLQVGDIHRAAGKRNRLRFLSDQNSRAKERGRNAPVSHSRRI